LAVATDRWSDLLMGDNALRSAILAGGVGIHAVNIFLVTTLLPSIVDDIGGLDFYAWVTTVFVVASIVGSAIAPNLLRYGSRGSYLLALGLFAAGSTVCAIAPAMLLLLAGRVLQGLGGGLLVALSYALIRRIFAQALWARAISMVSGVWGAAALSGPFAGGVFADWDLWRGAFLALLPVTGLFAALCWRALPQDASKTEGPPVPAFRLVLLAAAVGAISVGSVSATAAHASVGTAAAFLLLAGLLCIDRKAIDPILPADVLNLRLPLAAIFGMMLLLILGTTTIVFVPLFLQRLFGLSPLLAGYVTVLEALGWTGAALATAGFSGESASRVIRLGPYVMAAGLAGLAMTLPTGSPLAWVSVALVASGAGVGMTWAHLSSLAMTTAAPGQHDVVASSISTIQLIATALGSAIAGLVANASGVLDPGSAGLRGAALVLFGTFATLPMLAGVALAGRATRSPR
jgi:MFS family permease